MNVDELISEFETANKPVSKCKICADPTWSDFADRLKDKGHSKRAIARFMRSKGFVISANTVERHVGRECRPDGN